MEIIGRKKFIDYSAFTESPGALSAKHGLPEPLTEHWCLADVTVGGETMLRDACGLIGFWPSQR